MKALVLLVVLALVAPLGPGRRTSHVQHPHLVRVLGPYRPEPMPVHERARASRGSRRTTVHSDVRASRGRRRAPVSHRADRSSNSLWDRLAACESGGRWDLNTGAFDGGLQFAPSTWTAYVRRYGLTRLNRDGRRVPYPPYAWQASRLEQIALAQLVLRLQGWSAWPGCARKLGLR